MNGSSYYTISGINNTRLWNASEIHLNQTRLKSYDRNKHLKRHFHPKVQEYRMKLSNFDTFLKLKLLKNPDNTHSLSLIQFLFRYS